MIDLRASLTTLVKAAVIACSGIVCLAVVWAVVSVVTSRNTQQRLLWTIGLSDMANLLMEPPSGFEHWQEVSPHHYAVVSWVLECTKIKDPSGLPDYLQASFRAGGGYVSGRGSGLPAGARPPLRQERALVQLSNVLADQRVSLREKAQSSYMFWQVTSLITIALGMVTTILVSFSSTEFGRGDGPSQRIIRILAIVFPALGTAAAAVVAFYQPQADWGQSSRTLASLTQLHGQVAVGIWKLECVETLESKDQIKHVNTQFEEWSKLYANIQTAAGAGTQANSATGSAAGPREGTPPGGTPPVSGQPPVTQAGK